MTRTGIDVAWARPTVAQIKATGATWVARYFSNDDNKDLHAAEVHAYPAAGIDIVVVFETTTGRARAGRAAGVADARNADAQRKAAGLPDDMVLHFAVDEDTSWASVAPYFDGVASYLGQTRTGVYGGLDVINGAYAAGYRYLWQTVAWSRGQWSPHATIRQTGGTTLSGSADWDTAMVTDFGQYPRPITPQEDTLPTAQDVWSYSHGDDPDVHQTLADAATSAAAAAKGVATLLKGAPVTLSDAQLTQLAAKVAPLLPKPPSAADIATELAKRLQS